MIGIFGGTFDPIHLGHTRPVIETAKTLSLEKVHMVLCARPPHREQPVATIEQRWELLKLVVSDVSKLVADDRELRRPGPSYTVDTLHSFREEMPDKIFCLLIGSDSLASLDTWHDWEQIGTLAHIVVMRRPGWSINSISGTVQDFVRSRIIDSPKGLLAEQNGRVWLQDVRPQDISASGIRTLLAAGESAERLLDGKVYHYIKEYGLYGTG